MSKFQRDRMNGSEMSEVTTTTQQGNDEPTTGSVIWNLSKSSFQTAIGYICIDLVFAISIHFAAIEVNAQASSAVGLAYTVCGILLLPMGFGLNQSMNLHIAQCLGNNQEVLGKTYLPITLYLQILCFVPFCAIIYFMKVPFSYLIPEEDRDDIVSQCWVYLPWMMLGTLLAILLECVKSFLIAYQIFLPFLFIHPISLVLHIFWCWLLSAQYDMGLEGIGIAAVITESTNFLLLGIALLFVESYRVPFQKVPFTFAFFSQLSLVGSYLKSSFSIVIHIFADFLGFFQMLIVGMQLGTDRFNAQLSFANTSALYFKIPISLSIGLMTYVGIEMGQRRPLIGQLYTKTACVIFVICAGSLMGLLMLFRESWADFYTSDEHQKEIMLETLPYFLFCCVFIDGFQGTLSGALKGIEKKDLVSNSTLIVYYVLGLPLLLTFTFSWGLDLGVKGIWLAFGICNFILLVIYAATLLKANWFRQADKICQRIDEQEKQRSKNQTKLIQNKIGVNESLATNAFTSLAEN